MSEVAVAENTWRLAIIIPVHNRRSFTQSCLQSLMRQTTKDFQVVVVDDGSTDGTIQMINEDFPEITYLQGDGSLWWSGATNMGIRYSLDRGSEFIITLNDDTIAEPDFIEAMLSSGLQNTGALIGALAIDVATQKPVYGGERKRWWLDSSEFLLDTMPENERKGLHEVTHFPGRGLLIPRGVFEKVGYFDEENFPQAAADFDFTHRAARAGFKIYCNYDACLRIFPYESGDARLRRTKSITNYYAHLTHIKGGGNLVRFWKYAIKNSPYHQLVPCLLVGSLRRLLGYIIDWVREKGSGKA